MPWFYLFVAGLFEIGFTTCLKLSDGLSKLGWAAGFVFCLAISMAFLTLAVRDIPMGTAYAVWTGIGAAGTAIVGIAFFKEPATAWRLVFLTLLIGSVIGLKVVTPAAKPEAQPSTST